MSQDNIASTYTMPFTRRGKEPQCWTKDKGYVSLLDPNNNRARASFLIEHNINTKSNIEVAKTKNTS